MQTACQSQELFFTPSLQPPFVFFPDKHSEEVGEWQFLFFSFLTLLCAAINFVP